MDPMWGLGRLGPAPRRVSGRLASTRRVYGTRTSISENSAIEWCRHTFNPWWGCTRVSPACEHCYAEVFAKRLGLGVWGVQAYRRFFGDAHWNEPVRWNRKAATAGIRERVFSGSMCDVFEDRPDLEPHRRRLLGPDRGDAVARLAPPHEAPGEHQGDGSLGTLVEPLAMHPLARGAARAHLCAVARGKGEELANALMELTDLSVPGLLKTGAAVGLDPKALEACMSAPETNREASKSEQLLTRLGLLQGLPTTFIGSKMIVGAVEAPALREAFEQAAAGVNHGVPAPIYASLVALAAAASLWFGRRGRRAEPRATPAAGQ